jgi:hypothetical protein
VAQDYEDSQLRIAKDLSCHRTSARRCGVMHSCHGSTTEWIAGHDVIDCADLDEAIEIAAKHPMARYGQIEIRPMWPFE